MPQKRSYLWPIVTIIVGLFIVVTALPSNMKAWMPGFLRAPTLHFGLDLAGGTQLDFRISEHEMQEQIRQLEEELKELEETGAAQDRLNAVRMQLQNVREQQRTVVEAIRNVLERRINALGVSEAVITPSYIGDEKHLLVECPGVVDVQQCIATVGKTIKLEFKEEFTEDDGTYATEVRARVANVRTRITASGQTLATVGEDISDELGVAYINQKRYFRDELPEGLDALWNRQSREGILEREGVLSVAYQDPEGVVTESEIPGIYLAEVTQPRTLTGRTITDIADALKILAERNSDMRFIPHEDLALDEGVAAAVRNTLLGMRPGEARSAVAEDGTARILYLYEGRSGREEMEGSHILVTYAGAAAAEPGVTRTKDDAYAKALDLKRQLDEGADFAALARQNSDGPSGEKEGSLGTFGKDTMVPAFSDVAFALPEGGISDPVETQFGYHIIRSDRAPSVTPARATFDELVISGADAATRAESFLAQVQNGEVRTEEEAIVARVLFHSLKPTGWKDTALDGKYFETATVTLQPNTSLPIVQITFNEEGGNIFQELTKRNVNKRIAIFVGGELVSAPTVQQEIVGGTAIITGSQNFDEAKQLATDLNTGAIPAPIYLSGQRTVEATLGASAFRTSLQAALIGTIIVMLYMIFMYRLLGFLADIALAIYALIFLALLKFPLLFFSSQYIVLTLAGVAGIILSIGMAVDANVLIFERMKEELRKGKLLSTATEIGFKRAWPSIRDGNFSTFITCAILFVIGTSIVRGFAVTLSIGIVISMFTAIVITRWLVRIVARSPLATRLELFGVSKKVDGHDHH